MIEIKNLSKKIGDNKILDGLSFSVKKGEVLGFLGPNGAGKTTTMKIITSFWEADSGIVTVDGLDVSKNSLETREKIGYLPEMVPLYDDMKVYEYLKFVAEMRDIKKEEIEVKINEVVNKCGLKTVIKKTIDELSKGYRQRVGLAQAIIHNPDVLILDEPTTGLDPNQIIEIRDLIKNIGKEKTVIFSTHILSEVSALCDRVVIINKGKITGEGSPTEIVNKSVSKEKINLTLRANKANVLNKFKESDNILSVELKETDRKDVFVYEIEVRDNIDIRERLCQFAVRQNWGVLELTKSKASLEEAFRELTK